MRRHRVSDDRLLASLPARLATRSPGAAIIAAVIAAAMLTAAPAGAVHGRPSAASVMYVGRGQPATDFRAATNVATSLGLVSVFGADWCPACRSLETQLQARGVPFIKIDIDRQPAAYALAAHLSNIRGIPLSGVAHDGTLSWVQGADAFQIEQLYRGSR